MPRLVKLSISSATVLLLASVVRFGGAQQINKTDIAAPTSQVFALTDTKDLVVEPGVKAEAVEYRGRKAVRLTKEAVDEPALAFVNGTHFRTGRLKWMLRRR
jgi:hypothetical protein